MTAKVLVLGSIFSNQQKQIAVRWLQVDDFDRWNRIDLWSNFKVPDFCILNLASSTSNPLACDCEHVEMCRQAGMQRAPHHRVLLEC